MKTAKKIPIVKTRARIKIICICLLLFLSLLIYNLFDLQYINYAYYKDKVFDQVTTTSRQKAKRGIIYDSSMNILAKDSTSYRVFISPREIKRREKSDGVDYKSIIAKIISEATEGDFSSIYKKISTASSLDYTLIKSADEATYKYIMAKIYEYSLSDMLSCEAQNSRYYPEGSLLCHTLGFVGSDLQGLYGLEYYYNSILSGTDGYYLYAKDATGNTLKNEYQSFIPPTDGYSIVTTVDSYLQGELEAIVEKARINHSAQNRVCAVAMDIKTGGILAMATSGAFDLNSPYTLDPLSEAKLISSGFDAGSEEYLAKKKELLEIMWSNKPISELYEPGSTFKIVTVSAGLDSGAVKMSDTFSCQGYLAVGGYRIRCHKAKGHGSGFNLAYGLQMSCNPCMMTVASRLGSDKFYDYVERFGYLDKTGIDLPSEASGIFHKEGSLGTTELATASFGQRFKISIIRQLASIATVANGGVSVTPHLLSRVIDKNGRVVSVFKEENSKRVVSEEVASLVTDALVEGVSGDGGAKNASVAGYDIAGKTGTSQKFDILDENGNSYLRVGSTVAYSKIGDGGIAVILVVDEPTSQVKYGSVVAAPYISEFLAKALPYLGAKSSVDEATVEVPNFLSIGVSEANALAKSVGLSIEIVGGGENILAQTPTPLDTLNRGGRVILYTEATKPKYIELPSVVGLDASEANKILTNLGFNIKIRGRGGTVLSQSHAQGSVLPYGNIIEIETVYEDFAD